MDNVTLPKLGQTMEKALIEKWHVSEGDEVSKGDVLLEITTDKATLEVESYVSGTVRKITAAEGEERNVGTLIALVGTPDEDIPDIAQIEKDLAAEAAASEEPAEAAAAPAPEKKGKPGRKERVRATPRAKKLAKQEGVELSGITGTGPGGRITEDDVKAAASGGGAPAGVSADVPDDVEKKPLSAMRRVIADNMTRSSQEAPHFYLTVEIDMTQAVELRKKLKEETGVSYNDMIVKACAVAISEIPGLNATWLGDAVGERKAIGVGLAVSLEDGLIVPVVKDAEKKVLAEVAKATQDLIERARSKKLMPEEYGCGSMTVSNLGMFGIDSFMPVINLGESMILGVGRIQDRAIVVDGQVAVRKMNTMTVACDHRVVDGAQCGKFLGRIKELLEAPDQL